VSKPLYAVRNGENVLGMLWETNSDKQVFVTLTNEIDINHDLEIWDIEINQYINNVDLHDLLMDVLPHKNIKDEV
jgi:hypothetical protein